MIEQLIYMILYLSLMIEHTFIAAIITKTTTAKDSELFSFLLFGPASATSGRRVGALLLLVWTQ